MVLKIIKVGAWHTAVLTNRPPRLVIRIVGAQGGDRTDKAGARQVHSVGAKATSSQHWQAARAFGLPVEGTVHTKKVSASVTAAAAAIPTLAAETEW